MKTHFIVHYLTTSEIYSKLLVSMHLPYQHDKLWVIALFYPVFPDFQRVAFWKVPRLCAFTSLLRATCNGDECGALVE